MAYVEPANRSDVHDTILSVTVFRMYYRNVDGLAGGERVAEIVEHGYSAVNEMALA